MVYRRGKYSSILNIHGCGGFNTALHAYLDAARAEIAGGAGIMGILTKTAIPSYLKANGAVYGHDLGLIGIWPHSPMVAEKLRKLWNKECRVWLDGGYEIVRVEKAK